ncbi:MAG TPA: lipocalin-like domain-containing protein [Candidatus Babeliales bacterium]|nr:lipocalin-like domain-containing protein [Candidatus Babeliales bacterium]
MNATQVREKLVGSWRFISSVAEGESSLGDDPVGQLMYDASGRVSAQLMRRNQARFQSEDWRQATSEEKTAAWSGYFGYFGTYTIDASAGTVTHHVEGSSFPNLVGTDQVRTWSFDGNRLELFADAPWGPVSIVWEKITLSS